MKLDWAKVVIVGIAIIAAALVTIFAGTEIGKAWMTGMWAFVALVIGGAAIRSNGMKMCLILALALVVGGCTASQKSLAGNAARADGNTASVSHFTATDAGQPDLKAAFEGNAPTTTWTDAKGMLKQSPQPGSTVAVNPAQKWVYLDLVKDSVLKADKLALKLPNGAEFSAEGVDINFNVSNPLGRLGEMFGVGVAADVDMTEAEAEKQRAMTVAFFDAVVSGLKAYMQGVPGIGGGEP